MPIYQDFVGLNTLGTDDFLIKPDDRTSVNAMHKLRYSSNGSEVYGPASWFTSGTDTFTFSAWIKLDTNDATGGGDFLDDRWLFSVQDASGNQVAGLKYVWDTDKWEWEFYLTKSDGASNTQRWRFAWSLSKGTTVIDNYFDWTQITFTVNRSLSPGYKQCRMYVNGELISWGAGSTANTTSYGEPSLLHFLQKEASNNDVWQGAAHSFSFWNTCLTDDQVREFYNKGKVLTYDRIPPHLKNGMIEFIPLGDEVLPIWGKNNHRFREGETSAFWGVPTFKGMITAVDYKVYENQGVKTVLHENALQPSDPSRVSRIAQNTLGLSYNLLYYKNPRSGDHYDASESWELPVPRQWRPLDWAAGSDVIASPLQFNVLITKRNGPYGWPTWKQIKNSENPLTRKQQRNNVFTFVTSPGPSRIMTVNKRNIYQTDRFSPIQAVYEPPVSNRSKPLTLIGGIKTYNQRTNRYNIKNIQIKTSFGNETDFFANKNLNNVYGTIEETDDNYENFKELYLDDGLESDASPIERFNIMIYKQTVWPKMENAFLNKTRSRTHFVNKFWRNKRIQRNQLSASNGFSEKVPHQSMFPLDVAADWHLREEPLLTAYGHTSTPGSNPVRDLFYGYYVGGDFGTNGFNFDTGARPYFSQSTRYYPTSSGGGGTLMNTYSHVACGYYRLNTVGTDSWQGAFLTGTSVSALPTFGSSLQDVASNLTASCYYARSHTLNTKASCVASGGMNISEITSRVNYNGVYHTLSTGSLFNGNGNWDAPFQAGKTPFYNSYSDFAEDTRVKGKGYSIVPEFRISSHVMTYRTKGVTEELFNIYELSGATAENTTTENEPEFYKILSNSDFLQHFDMIKEDHEDFAKPAIITLRCKAIKKFLPYEGFYPAQRTVQLSQQFWESYKGHISVNNLDGTWNNPTSASYGIQPVLEPLFAPGALFNTIKAGVACDYPVVHDGDGIYSGSANFMNGYGGMDQNYQIWHSDLGGTTASVGGAGIETGSGGGFRSMFSQRVPFEALIKPEAHMMGRNYRNNDPHPFALARHKLVAKWNGSGDRLYTKMANNFFAEVPEFFLNNQNFSTISSLESSNPEFGNAVSGNYYMMRVKMYRTTDKPNDLLQGFPRVEGSSNDNSNPTVEFVPPQDMFCRNAMKETFTMYSRPSAFGPPMACGFNSNFNGPYHIGGLTWNYPRLDGLNGFNFAYSPPYYHGEAWCDLIFKASETKKYTLSEILNEAKAWPYYTRFEWRSKDVLRDLAGGLPVSAQSGEPYYKSAKYYNYSASAANPWKELIEKTITFGEAFDDPTRTNWSNWHGVYPDGVRLDAQHSASAPTDPMNVNYNAMQLNSSVNLFGKGLKRSRQLATDGNESRVEVFSSTTNDAKACWTIQTKFETPMLNFNHYRELGVSGCTAPVNDDIAAQTSRGMWHQYGKIPEDNEGVYIQVDDIPKNYLRGQLGISYGEIGRSVRSLADLCGFDKEPVKLGQCAKVKQISEAVVAVPFIEEGNTRKFFSIPRSDIDDVISALRREVEPGVFIAGGPPKVGKSIIDMVKKMKNYIMPPSMDFVRYKEIDPFSVYIFEFSHNLTEQDLADVWQNLPPTIGTECVQSEASLSHPLFAEELLGGGSVIEDGKLIPRSTGNDVPSNIQWMIFKAKRRAKTKYSDKIVSRTGLGAPPVLYDAYQRGEDKDLREIGGDPEITYNWPYDFFSLVELVKLDAEIGFADVESIKQQSKIKPKIANKVMSRGEFASKGIATARGLNKK